MTGDDKNHTINIHLHHSTHTHTQVFFLSRPPHEQGRPNEKAAVELAQFHGERWGVGGMAALLTAAMCEPTLAPSLLMKWRWSVHRRACQTWNWWATNGRQLPPAQTRRLAGLPELVLTRSRWVASAPQPQPAAACKPLLSPSVGVPLARQLISLQFLEGPPQKMCKLRRIDIKTSCWGEAEIQGGLGGGLGKKKMEDSHVLHL